MTLRSIGVEIAVTFLVMALVTTAGASLLVVLNLFDSLPARLVVFGLTGGAGGGLSQLALRKLRSGRT